MPPKQPKKSRKVQSKSPSPMEVEQQQTGSREDSSIPNEELQAGPKGKKAAQVPNQNSKRAQRKLKKADATEAAASKGKATDHLNTQKDPDQKDPDQMDADDEPVEPGVDTEQEVTAKNLKFPNSEKVWLP